MQHLLKQELQKLLIVARQHSERDWLILLLSNHALRVSEVTALTASNVRERYLCFDRLKGSQSSIHQLFPSEREAIEHLARTKPVGRLFPISRIQVGRVMKKYCRLAGVPEHKSHHHVLKHSTCMNMLDGGAQINEVQMFAGDKSLNSTAQYLKVSDER